MISSSIEGFNKNTNHDICFESRKPRQKYIVAKQEKVFKPTFNSTFTRFKSNVLDLKDKYKLYPIYSASNRLPSG